MSIRENEEPKLKVIDNGFACNCIVEIMKENEDI